MAAQNAPATSGAQASPIRPSGDPRTDRAGPVGLFDGLVLLAGLYLVISPFVVGFGMLTDVAANDVITGVVLALLAVGCARGFDRMRSIAWVIPVIGAWIVVAPWVIYHPPANEPLNVVASPPVTTPVWLSNVVAGAVVVLAGVGLAALRADRGAR
jgi:hypothetical protein